MQPTPLHPIARDALALIVVHETRPMDSVIPEAKLKMLGGLVKSEEQNAQALALDLAFVAAKLAEHGFSAASEQVLELARIGIGGALLAKTLDDARKHRAANDAQTTTQKNAISRPAFSGGASLRKQPKKN